MTLEHNVRDFALANKDFIFGFNITGGGSQAISELLRHGGASKYFGFAEIPYAQSITDSILGYQPEKYVSEEVGRQLAFKAYLKLVYNGIPADKAIGVGVSAKLSVANQREGRSNESWIVLYGQKHYKSSNIHYHISFTRESQEYALAQDIICDMTHLLGDGSLELEYINETILSKKPYYIVLHAEPLDPLKKQKISYLSEAIIFPGSFNPAHEGHLRVVNKTKEKYPDKEVIPEICVKHPDKGELDGFSVYNRCKQLFSLGFDKVIVSNIGLYCDKEREYGATHFLMGSDTLIRIHDSKYNSSPLYSNYIVFPRKGYDVDKDDWKHTFWELIEDCVDDGISSTKIRNSE